MAGSRVAIRRRRERGKQRQLGPYFPVALKGEFQKVTPRLQADIRSTPLPSGMQITSLISGPHVANSAHFQGRAVDVSLPHTKAAWDFAVAQIKSGKWSRIGSTAEVVSNPQMQAIARQYGVTLFDDEGTGSHLHLEVAP